MKSLRNNPEVARSSEDLALDAAREAILAVGWSRTTLTDIARRAGLSRMTLYRRWPEMSALLGDLMTREWDGLVTLPAGTDARAALVDGVVATVGALRDNELFARIVELDPQMLLPYLLERTGRSQDHVLDLLVAGVTAGQQDGSVRAGDPGTMARAVVLTAHGFTLSAQTMTSGRTSTADLDRELAALLESYLRP
ncbi:TetR/AcrR family transcriptional regulator [Marmoricola sp. RAF53]|uniref:TetR/AcrR family transcriptional regulator n=1 Tax=Marmoricola sp. RAF53 TaxID=3233059 RepID=UPI003F987115